VGYKVYSAFPLEIGVSRIIWSHLSVELSSRNESREVDQAQTGALDLRLGSIELLPVNLLLQFHPFTAGAFRPYFGAGGNVTFGWEKSGVLDPMALSTAFGPALQAGFDVDLSNYAVLNVDYRWNTMRTDLKSAGARIATLSIDPAAIGVGIGMRL
jgi:outer membrane protein